MTAQHSRLGRRCMGIPILLAQHGYGKVARRNRSEAGNPAFNSYQCGDGVGVQLLGLQQPRHLPKLLKAIGLDSMVAADARFNTAKAMNKNRRALVAMIDATFRSKSFDQWAALLDAHDVWYCKV